MSVTPTPARLFTDKTKSYVRFIRFVRYPQGIRAYFVRSPLLRSGLRILDAGCGTGVVTLALRDALVRRGLRPQSLHAFDLTPAMLERFRATLRARRIDGIDMVQADVLRLDDLPPSWKGYDVLVSASMLEYIPRDRLVDALAGLRSLLLPGGSFVLFMTRRNLLTRPLIGRWWQSNLYTAEELRSALTQAGFSHVEFDDFPPSARLLSLWGYIVRARA